MTCLPGSAPRSAINAAGSPSNRGRLCRGSQARTRPPGYLADNVCTALPAGIFSPMKDGEKMLAQRFHSIYPLAEGTEFREIDDPPALPLPGGSGDVARAA